MLESNLLLVGLTSTLACLSHQNGSPTRAGFLASSCLGGLNRRSASSLPYALPNGNSVNSRRPSPTASLAGHGSACALDRPPRIAAKPAAAEPTNSPRVCPFEVSLSVIGSVATPFRPKPSYFCLADWLGHSHKVDIPVVLSVIIVLRGSWFDGTTACIV